MDGDGDKVDVEDSGSLPRPIFQVKGPNGVDLAALTFVNTGSNNSWKLVSVGDGYYRFEPTAANMDAVRVQYSDGTKVVTEDEFTPETDVFKEYTVTIYAGETAGEVQANATDKYYTVITGPGVLTVRAVETADPTSDIVATEPTSAVEENKAVAVAPAGTTYTLNDTDVALPTDGTAKPSLLFDEIITSDGVDRIDALENAVDTKLGTTNGTRHYEAKYLDLVDANNGNAWIKASNDVTIYWGYPKDTDQNTTFKLLHFEDLHRDTSGSDNTGFNPDDIADSTIDDVEVNTTANGISFTVEPGGFSPFVLVWEAKPEPEPEPEPEPTPPPYIPPVDPDDTGVSDLLNTEDHIQYLFGYPEGTFGPENDMTRAEVAQMFYNLLLDQDVEITKTFDDVSEDAWYAKAVNTLASLGVVSGVGDNKFEPNRSITRAEFTTMAMKFAVGGEEGENIFSDVDEDDWFYKAVVDSIQYGWIHGYPDGTFRPNNSITRAEVTAIVNNMLGREADEDFVDEHAEELTQFSDIEKHWAYYHIAEATNDHDYTQPSSGENWTRLN